MPTEVVKKNIVLLGDAAVGKTSLIRRFVLDQFSDDYITTIGSKTTKKELTLENGGDKINMVLMVRDIIGQRDYKYTQSISFQGMHGALLVADLTRKETLESLRGYWIPLLLKASGPIPMIFLGNKADLTYEKKFGLKGLEEVAASCAGFGSQGVCYLTSAKTGAHVEDAFKSIANLSRAPRAGISVGGPWNLMDPAEVGSPKEALDHIIADFAERYGGIDYATPVIKHQMDLSGLNLTHPTEAAVIKFIDQLSKIEITFKTPEEVADNRMKRMRLFGYKEK
jgi:small GTP-binding protein